MNNIKTDLRANSLAFHVATGAHVGEKPGSPSDKEVRLRANVITEQYFHTMRALFSGLDGNRYLEEARIAMAIAIEDHPVSIVLVEFANGLACLEHACESGFLAFGIDSGPIHAEVQRAAMEKVGAPAWAPPNIRGEIERQLSAPCAHDHSLALHDDYVY